MSKYIRVRGQLYRAVDAKGDFLRDTRRIKEVANNLSQVARQTWWQGLSHEEYEDFKLSESEKNQLNALIKQMQIGQQKLRQALKLVEASVGDYAKLEKDYHKFNKLF